MTDPLVEARMRAKLYWYRDGLSEIWLGIIFLFLGGSDLLRYFGDHLSSWYLPVTLMYTGLFLTLVLFVPRIKAAVLERVAYPRRGYVRELGRKRRVVAMMICALAFMVASVVLLRYARQADWDVDRWIRWLPALGGLAIGAIGVYMAVRYGVRRLLVVGGITFVLGVVASIEYSHTLAVGIWLVGSGCAWLGSGGMTLWNYLRTVPPTADAT